MARKNMAFGIAAFVVILCMLGITFVWATIYLSTVKPSL